MSFFSSHANQKENNKKQQQEIRAIQLCYSLQNQRYEKIYKIQTDPYSSI